MGSDKRSKEWWGPDIRIVVALVLLPFTGCATYKAVADLPVDYWVSTENLLMALFKDISSIIGLFLLL